MKLFFILLIVLLSNSCSSKTNPKKINIVNNRNTTLDYEDGLRAKCNNDPIDYYRYQNNNNYRMGWINGSKNCLL